MIVRGCAARPRTPVEVAAAVERAVDPVSTDRMILDFLHSPEESDGKIDGTRAPVQVPIIGMALRVVVVGFTSPAAGRAYADEEPGSATWYLDPDAGGHRGWPPAPNGAAVAARWSVLSRDRGPSPSRAGPDI